MNLAQNEVVFAIGFVVIIGLQVAILLRRSRVAIPGELAQVLATLDQQAQTIVLAVSKNEGAVAALGFQLNGVAETHRATLDAIRLEIDQKLALAVSEARAGRTELTAAFSTFETKLDARLSTFDATVGTRFEALQSTVSTRLDQIGNALSSALDQLQADAGTARKELAGTLTTFRNEINGVLTTLTGTTRQMLDAMKLESAAQLSAMSSAMREQLEGAGNQLRTQFSTLQDSLSQNLATLSQTSQQIGETLRSTVSERLTAIQSDSNAKLELMRATVDEKLHATLEQRLGDSFKLVSERLEQVHRGLGEMQTLATGVGDLKKVLTNVKSRGTWGEIQLGALLDQILTADQYSKNVATKQGSNSRVEYAIKLPGRRDENGVVWLPIDAKFPQEDYQRLLEAQERGDPVGADAFGAALEQRIKSECKKIKEAYIDPPNTTDFAMLYLPTEGLYAEVLRRPGLVDTIQREFKINLAGPTTLAAMLNSLQMGFKTLAIEKRSSEVWTVLAAVKTEFSKFGEALAHTKKKLEEARSSIDHTEQRNRVLTRKLSDVEALPTSDTPEVLGVTVEALPIETVAGS